MGKHTGLYLVCLVLFPVAFAAFVVGFGCPVWVAADNVNNGLWQHCQKVFKDCNTLDFDNGGDWMIGVRAVEIFALVMLSVVAAEVLYENCCTDFRGRKPAERVAPGVICVLAGCGGLAGVITFAVKKDDDITADGSNTEYGWAFMLVAAGSGLAFLIGIGFCTSGIFLENGLDSDKTPINAYGGTNPYLTQPLGGDAYEMNAYSNKGFAPPAATHINGGSSHMYGNGAAPGPALYHNGGVGGRSRNSYSSPMDLPSQDPYNRESVTRKGPQYYSYSGGLDAHPDFDLSEGYLPTLPRVPPPAAEDPYYGRGGGGGPRAEDPYARGGGGGRGMDESYVNARGGGRGMDESYVARGGGRGGGGMEPGYMGSSGRYDDARENFYRSGRY